MKNLITAILCGILIQSCQKADPNPQTSSDGFFTFHIPKGAHSCEESEIKAVSVSEMRFHVRFDSSAIYKTTDPENQFDINKLYGFSEGTNHHQNSARIGWSYNKDSLRLYAYAYNNGERLEKEICAVNIGQEISCAIRIEGNNYFFSVNNVIVQLQRFFDLPVATGHQLFPYFGGDETAPHAITIFIRDMSAVK